jgi:hypothetical protein
MHNGHRDETFIGGRKLSFLICWRSFSISETASSSHDVPFGNSFNSWL